MTASGSRLCILIVKGNEQEGGLVAPRRNDLLAMDDGTYIARSDLSTTMTPLRPENGCKPVPHKLESCTASGLSRSAVTSHALCSCRDSDGSRRGPRASPGAVDRGCRGSASASSQRGPHFAGRDVDRLTASSPTPAVYCTVERALFRKTRTGPPLTGFKGVDHLLPHR